MSKLEQLYDMIRQGNRYMRGGVDVNKSDPTFIETISTTSINDRLVTCKEFKAQFATSLEELLKPYPPAQYDKADECWEVCADLCIEAGFDADARLFNDLAHRRWDFTTVLYQPRRRPRPVQQAIQKILCVSIQGT